MHLYSSGTRGFIINMISAGTTITLDILQHFESEDLINAVLSSLDEIAVDYSVTKLIPFETKKDKAYRTAGRQAERYYK